MTNPSPLDLVQQPAPDLTLIAPDGSPWRIRQFVGVRPLVLFFFIHSGTSGCVREMREFRIHREEYRAAGVEVAGVSLDTPESNRDWMARLDLPYLLLSDSNRTVGDAFGLIRRLGVGTWSVEFFVRNTVLIDMRGMVAGAWTKVKIRGHAIEVLEAAKLLPAD